MKSIISMSIALVLTLQLHAQVSGIEIRLGGDLWKTGYTASSSQINCGLCPRLANQSPETLELIRELQDSVVSEHYTRTGSTVAIAASLISPAFRVEVQVGPSMRKLNQDAEQIGRYVNRNISAFVGLNPMQLTEYAGRYYLGAAQSFYLDLSDGGVYAQFSYDGGFEEFVRSTNNVAILARWQPTIWLSDEKQFGLALRGGLRYWLLGNGNARGPFTDANGLPKKVKPAPDWFLGFAIKIAPFSAFQN
ncbi:MAG: hypothetical protein D6730_04005 [Bacteroidetes bacterium]|nr:MAG: hypothetical protein D6730_04005 [Bacteroidota bacterium]